MADEFGNLESVKLRKVWRHEAHNFTPWLADNLDRLYDAIGIRLELIGTEVPVGPFSADVLALNPLDNSVVLIENQLEWSDHTHLGQILTYLVGLEAQTMIWVARNFQGAHLSAIRWLNENTSNSFNFFAIRVRVVRIGASALAPIFEVLERPSEWDRQVRAMAQEGSESSLSRSRREFWAHYVERYPNDGVPQVRRSANVYHRFEGAGLHISQYLARDEVGLWISKLNGTNLTESSRELVAPFLPALAKALEVDPGQLRSNAHRTLPISARDRDNWDKATDWLHEHLEIYRGVLTGPPPEPAQVSDAQALTPATDQSQEDRHSATPVQTTPE